VPQPLRYRVPTEIHTRYNFSVSHSFFGIHLSKGNKCCQYVLNLVRIEKRKEALHIPRVYVTKYSTYNNKKVTEVSARQIFPMLFIQRKSCDFHHNLIKQWAIIFNLCLHFLNYFPVQIIFYFMLIKPHSVKFPTKTQGKIKMLFYATSQYEAM
jgi:hypothetical protein